MPSWPLVLLPQPTVTSSVQFETVVDTDFLICAAILRMSYATIVRMEAAGLASAEWLRKCRLVTNVPTGFAYLRAFGYNPVR